MRILGKTYATTPPKSVEITETKAFVAENVQEVEIQTEEGQQIQYEFDYIEYELYEYLAIMQKEITRLTELIER